MRQYPELPGLEALYLEDSYVLGIEEEPREVRVQVDAVLTDAHPKWTAPKPTEQYSYLRVDLVFPNPRSVEWLNKAMQPIRDASGETDYGNIDTFVWRPGLYELTGEWGHVRIESDPPIVAEP